MTSFPTEDWLVRPNGLAQRLRAAREASDMQQKELAAALSWDPGKLSKTESGKRAPTAPDIHAWAKATGLSDVKRDEMLAMLDQLRTERTTWKDRMRHGRTPVQHEYARLYAESTRFRIFQTVMVPGILQIADYARQIFIDLDDLTPGTPRDVNADVQARLARGQHLYDLSKQFEIILTEPVLSTLVVDPPVMRAQLDRLISATMLPNVRLGIVPRLRRIRTAPQTSFTMYDDLAIVDNYVTDTQYRDEEAKVFANAMRRHWDDAVEADAARQLIRSVMEELADG